MVFGIFLFCLDLELFAKMKKFLFLHTRRNQFFYICINNSKSKENSKISNTIL